jgi:polyisoprenyl-teichoic acid--peptidoglycan teichoic acid transferase
VHAHRLRASARPYDEPESRATDRRRLLSAALSAIVPGLGQAANANARLALLFGLPSLVLLLAIWLTVQGSSTARIAAALMVPATLGPVLVLNVMVLLWRLASVGQAFLDRRYPVGPSARAVGLFALVVVFVAVPHLVAGWLGYSAYDNFKRIFAAPASAATVAGPGDHERLNILLIGVDSAPSRAHALADTLIVVSLDPVARKIAMLSIPRDLTNVPLGDGNTFAPKINSLMSFADRDRKLFPAGGTKALERAVGELLGVPIHYYARINLGGFVRMVDSVGGVDVKVARPLSDPNYGGYGVGPGWSIAKGQHHLDGANALAYARIRKTDGESDFTRAERQQEVLVAIRDSATKGGLVFRLTDLLDAVGDTVRTDLPADRLPGLAALAEEIGESDTTRVVMRAPLVRPASNGYGAVQVPNVTAIRAMAAALFPTPGVEPVPWPTPRPTKAPKPTP